MADNPDYQMNEDDKYYPEEGHAHHGMATNDVMPAMPGSIKNSRNGNMRAAHSEKPNKRQRNGFTASDPLNPGTYRF